jgi:hypothetical protein
MESDIVKELAIDFNGMDSEGRLQSSLKYRRKKSSLTKGIG